MKEYIDRQSVLSAIDMSRSTHKAVGERLRINDVVWIIKNARAADVVPVVHSEWEWYEKWIPSTTEHPAECQAFGWRCGNCKRDAQDMGFGHWDDPTEKPLMIYCPVCGAKMDGGNE